LCISCVKCHQNPVTEGWDSCLSLSYENAAVIHYIAPYVRSKQADNLTEGLCPWDISCL